jgi:hypothetical protein
MTAILLLPLTSPPHPPHSSSPSMRLSLLMLPSAYAGGKFHADPFYLLKETGACCHIKVTVTRDFSLLAFHYQFPLTGVILVIFYNALILRVSDNEDKFIAGVVDAGNYCFFRIFIDCL